MLVLQLVQKCIGSRTTRVTYKKKEVRRITLPDFRTYYKTTGIKIVWVFAKR